MSSIERGMQNPGVISVFRIAAALKMTTDMERIGDHATNIAENVWFLVHGDQPLPPRDKRDNTSTTGAL